MFRKLVSEKRLKSALSKIIEKAVHRQVMGFLEVNKFLSKFQFGFRPKSSTELAETLLFDEIRQHVDEGKVVGATFIDLSKAFDTISHSNLLQKLPQYGICDEELGWYTDYLFHRSMAVSYGSCLSNKQDIQTGVPQGSILGSLLFIIFFNDITNVIKSAQMVRYADDTVIYIADKDVANVLNISHYKFLGIEIDSSLNLNSHFDKWFKRVSSRLRLLGKLRDYLDLTAAETIYRSLILPTFTHSGILLLKLTDTKLRRLAFFIIAR